MRPGCLSIALKTEGTKEYKFRSREGGQAAQLEVVTVEEPNFPDEFLAIYDGTQNRRLTAPTEWTATETSLLANVMLSAISILPNTSEIVNANAIASSTGEMQVRFDVQTTLNDTTNWNVTLVAMF